MEYICLKITVQLYFILERVDLCQLQNLNKKLKKLSHKTEFFLFLQGVLFFVASANKQIFCDDANFSGLQTDYCNLENESFAELIHLK